MATWRYPSVKLFCPSFPHPASSKELLLPVRREQQSSFVRLAFGCMLAGLATVPYYS